MTEHKGRLLALILTAAVAAPSVGATPFLASTQVDPGLALLDEIGMRADADNDGRITDVEINVFAQKAFPLLDADGNGSLDDEEMRGTPAMSGLAAFRDREQAYSASMGVVFDLFDRDGSGSVDAEEYRIGLTRGAVRADRDGDGALSRNEFRNAFFVSRALRRGLIE
ncbi:EF hand [Jannaschia seosinensis]|uniref:EF hand n=1 Tax=Jannaschia seosinensis TaxID=313367 RepID=A0A0M7B9T6_9RHOB|nr:EF-hand domain-containing protein [Jannaschia seosinensis]CUH37366.1 EF hand [Jannaschia seosinensis]